MFQPAFHILQFDLDGLGADHDFVPGNKQGHFLSPDYYFACSWRITCALERKRPVHAASNRKIAGTTGRAW